MKTFDPQTTLELEAAAFRRLVDHLRSRPDVQNIDMMNLAGFCRNCLSGWMADAAKDRGVELSKDDARELVYGMPYQEWQARHQKAAIAGPNATARLSSNAQATPSRLHTSATSRCSSDKSLGIVALGALLRIGAAGSVRQSS